MSNKSDLFQATLKQNGYSLTMPRQTVFAALDTTLPLTMAELVRQCSDTTDRASVYRTVALFEKLGIATRVNTGWKYQLELSDQFSHHHHHLTCVVCGKVVKITESPAVEQAIQSLAERAGFTPGSHQLEIRGTCTSCQTTKTQLLIVSGRV
jgi:Fur family ferric uptake transcriptional regulator